MGFLKNLFNNYVNSHNGGHNKSNHHGRQRENLYPSNDSMSVKSCPFCRANIDSQSRFCGQCGKDTLMASCRCGALITAGTKFCGQCGNSL